MNKRIKCQVDIFQIGEKDLLTVQGFIAETDDKISVSYDDEDGENYHYSGQKLGEGHWVLAPTKKVWEEKMTLHKLPNSRIYEGFWKAKVDDIPSEGFIRVRI